ncbi:translation factor SUA5 [Fluviicoccus keumensis]|uniref:Threonylcarbamoyl-AMP synthase n=1 Tax=Fluviicoccus keumensis TaxID=1435465 RepID=A0A4Q7ZD69_9GAMM|nr:L-threonylcarbamoyladenylate synthase [Fluviicoccus keumensis]RZU47993.1 translation factor SUA5 [Fluviicoccus keumensis]
MRILSASPADLDQAAALLREGQPVGMPTETVYGLAGDARHPDALRAIFAAKGRPLDHPLIVHIHRLEELEEWADPVLPAATALAARFWPGPLTLVLRRRAGVSDLVTGGQETVAIRMPGHPVALALLQRFGGAVCAPSANRFGRISPTRAEHVREELDGRVAAVVDGGACAVGIESTIVDVRDGELVILRPGGIGAEALAACTGLPVRRAGPKPAVRVSGALDSHYAPVTPAFLRPRAALAAAGGKHPGGEFLLTFGPLPPGAAGQVLPDTPQACAAVLYAALRTADQAGCARILVEEPPADEAWAADAASAPVP